jgi:hypothetical protein
VTKHRVLQIIISLLIYFRMHKDHLCGQSSWLQIQRSGFNSQRYQILWREVVGLEKGPLSLVSTIEELLGRNSSDSGLETQDYCRRDPSRWPHGTLYPQKLAVTLPTSSGRSVSIVPSWTQATEFSFLQCTNSYSIFHVFPVCSISHTCCFTYAQSLPS